MKGLQQSNSIYVDFNVENKASCFVTLTNINFLHPIDIFDYEDITDVIKKGRYAELEPGI